MVKRERVSQNIYFFQSEEYAEVNAGVVVGPDMAVVIDTLAFPEESIVMRNFVERELQVPIRFLINTHYHADHSWGNFFFPGAKIIAHSLCYQLLEEKGIPSLEEAKKKHSMYKPIDIVLPHITFDDGEFGLQVGKNTIRIFSLPGHSKDCIAVLVEEERVLFSSDTLMPVPYIVDGDIDDTISSMKAIAKMGLENIVQGHGDIVLRGEIEGTAKNNIDYLIKVRKAVRQANRRKYPLDYLEEIDVESVGKSRVLLGGLAKSLHEQNLLGLYKKLYGEDPIGSEEYFEGE
ncbi:MAG: MBL fold metallo-hydrolase [Chloroflexota bacterium]